MFACCLSDLLVVKFTLFAFFAKLLVDLYRSNAKFGNGRVPYAIVQPALANRQEMKACLFDGIFMIPSVYLVVGFWYVSTILHGQIHTLCTQPFEWRAPRARLEQPPKDHTICGAKHQKAQSRWAWHSFIWVSMSWHHVNVKQEACC